jgi:sugar lactone lactonase YvrE
MLGGNDGKMLYVCTAPSSDPEICLAKHGGRIEAFEVDVARAGLP